MRTFRASCTAVTGPEHLLEGLVCSELLSGFMNQFLEVKVYRRMLVSVFAGLVLVMASCPGQNKPKP